VSVTIEVRLGPTGRGTFTLTGGTRDAGRAVARYTVASRTLRATHVLSGARGRLVIASSRPCSRSRGTWRIVSGAGAFAGAAGGGSSSEPPGCARRRKASRSTYRGLLTLPPPPLAAPGAYRGWTAQDKEVSFEVTPDGRSLTGILVGPHTYECVRSDGLKTRFSDSDRTIPGPVAIAEDGSFAVPVGASRLEGRFAASGATGNVTHSSTLPPDAQGRTTTCSGSIAWTASTPAPPAWRAQSGTYCGYTAEGQGVCLDVAADGRSVRNFHTRVVVACGARPPFDPRFLVDVAADRELPVRSDLSFGTSFTQRLETDGSALAFLQATLDRSGGVSGTLVLQQPSLTRDGTRYTCRNGGGAFTATLQR
jgi:hypothetical protein